MLFVRPQIIDTEEEINELTRSQQGIYNFKKRSKQMDVMAVEEALDFLNLKMRPQDDENPEFDYRDDYRKQTVLTLLSIIVLTGCSPVCTSFQPHISYIPQVCAIKSLPEGFKELDERELMSSWGKELSIGQEFLKENDLYRAITALKRAKILLPPKFRERRMQIDYTILLAYYLGNKYKEVTEIFEESSLYTTTATEFPLYDDLLVILYDSYTKMVNVRRPNAS